MLLAITAACSVAYLFIVNYWTSRSKKLKVQLQDIGVPGLAGRRMCTETPVSTRSVDPSH